MCLYDVAQLGRQTCTGPLFAQGQTAVTGPVTNVRVRQTNREILRCTKKYNTNSPSELFFEYQSHSQAPVFESDQ